MKPISDDDLVLLYYGEHEDPGLAARVAGDEDGFRRAEVEATERGCDLSALEAAADAGPVLDADPR